MPGGTGQKNVQGSLPFVCAAQSSGEAARLKALIY
jgi:hypothetical protein